MNTRAQGAAGRNDAGSRSDCYVEVAITRRSGITIDLTSKVEALYGDSIRLLVNDVLHTIGIAHARVSMLDQGAVPFVIAARVEAAAARALGGSCRPYPTPVLTKPNTTDRHRLRRTRLYLPGNEPRFFLNAGLHAPDGLILDLEDSVAPAEKDAARILVRNALRAVDFNGAERMVRINAGAMGLDDLREVIPQGVHVILIPKCESAADVASVAHAISSICAETDRNDPVYLLPIIESARGVVNAFGIASASDTICGLAIGLEDYCADIGVQRTREGKESAYARAAIVNAACAAGVQPLDSVFSDVTDMPALLVHARESKALGFKGMGCIHPRQIGVIHDAFAPTQQEIEKAQRIVRAFESAKEARSGVTVLDGRMIDMPVVLQALRTLTLAVSLGLVSAIRNSAGSSRRVSNEDRKDDAHAE